MTIKVQCVNNWFFSIWVSFFLGSRKFPKLNLKATHDCFFSILGQTLCNNDNFFCPGISYFTKNRFLSHSFLQLPDEKFEYKPEKKELTICKENNDNNQSTFLL